MSQNLIFENLIRRIQSLEALTRRMSVRQNNMFREGVVKEVDFQRGTAIVDAHGIETKHVPWLEQAGAVNEWTPPSVGQRVLLISPDGDLSKAVIMKGGYTSDTPAPHDKGAEKRVAIGDAVITHSADGLFISVAGTEFRFTGAGFEQVGGTQTHDGKNVGSTHIHGGVVPGGATTTPPAN